MMCPPLPAPSPSPRSILHDAAGTEAGIAIIAVLTYLSPVLAEEKEAGKQ